MRATTAYMIIRVNVHLVAVSKREREERRSIPTVVLLLITDTYNRHHTSKAVVCYVKTKCTEEYCSVSLNVVLELLKCNNHIVCSYP